MKQDKGPQGDLFGQRTKRSRVGNPARRSGEPTNATAPGRRGAQFVADPITAAQAERRRLIADKLEALALQTGWVYGAAGFALWHVREAGVVAKVLTGSEGVVNPRELSWLGSLLPGMARRGLVEKVTIEGRVQYDTSEGSKAHGNKNVLWRLTADGRTAAEAAQPAATLADRRP